MIRLRLPVLTGRRDQFAWGLVDQFLSSASTLCLTVLAAREFGPEGLGTIMLGFTAYLLVLGLQRAVVIDPLLTSTHAGDEDAIMSFRAALTLSLCGAISSGVLCVAVWLVDDSVVSRGLVLFAPWFAPALAFALMRAWLFREGRGRMAAILSALLLTSFVVLAAVGHRSDEWQLVAAWGLGTTAATVVAALRMPVVGLARPAVALRWFSQSAMRFAGWLATGSVLTWVFGYAFIVGLSSTLGVAAIGGYKVIESVFAPISLLGPAIANPGVPAMRDALDRSSASALRLATRLSALALLLAALYVIPVGLASSLVFQLFGEEFRAYRGLIVPIIAGQAVTAAGTGFGILLLSARQGLDVVVPTVMRSILPLFVALPLAASSGLTAAAWGIALSAVPSLVWVVVRGRAVIHGMAVRESATELKATGW